MRGIALVYFVAFVSLAVQIDGLYGSQGILPAAHYLQALTSHYGAGAAREVPTLFWWTGARDFTLAATCWAGALASVLLFAGLLPALSAAACWILYFSLFQIGRVFLSFQWDILLLEAGFLAIFLEPFRLVVRRGYEPEPPAVTIWMLRWLLFRLMFASGVVKLLSGDDAWWHLTALEYHYWTQPLPTWTAWLANQLPGVVQRLCCFGMFVIELGIPWFIFGPRAVRLFAFFALVLLQVLIASTGNYTFFNLLTIVLCISLLDDDAIGALKDRMRPGRDYVAQWPGEAPRRSLAATLRMAAGALVALPLAIAGGAVMIARFEGYDALPKPVAELVAAIQPYHLTSSYGLFSVMTKVRNEVILEGSNDGASWREYPMRWKPGDVGRAPMFVAPHQPRLDWQMWFAPLADWRRSPWLVDVEHRLVEGSAPVLGLFESDPFQGEPPRYVRAMLYEYQMTDLPDWYETGAWWKRRLIGQFSPTVSR